MFQIKEQHEKFEQVGFETCIPYAKNKCVPIKPHISFLLSHFSLFLAMFWQYMVVRTDEWPCFYNNNYENQHHYIMYNELFLYPISKISSETSVNMQIYVYIWFTS